MLHALAHRLQACRREHRPINAIVPCCQGHACGPETAVFQRLFPGVGNPMVNIPIGTNVQAAFVCQEMHHGYHVSSHIWRKTQVISFEGISQRKLELAQAYVARLHQHVVQLHTALESFSAAPFCPRPLRELFAFARKCVFSWRYMLGVGRTACFPNIFTCFHLQVFNIIMILGCEELRTHLFASQQNDIIPRHPTNPTPRQPAHHTPPTHKLPQPTNQPTN